MSDGPLAVLQEELLGKIAENATLHKRIHEVELDCGEAVERQRIGLERAQAERSSVAEKLRQVQAATVSQIERLQNDKIKLELTLAQKEAEIKVGIHDRS